MNSFLALNGELTSGVIPVKSKHFVQMETEIV
jgi:hypothetical protein